MVWCFIFLGLTSILITIFYTIPNLSAYITHQWYISPLAQNFSLQEAVGSRVTEYTLKEKLKKKGFTAKKILQDDESYQVVLSTDQKVIFSKDKSLDMQISSLQLISSRFTIEGKDFVQLDLRFDRPILVSK